MWTPANVLLCSVVVVVARAEVTFEADRPFLKVQLHSRAELECCFSSNGSETAIWYKIVKRNTTQLEQAVNSSSRVEQSRKRKDGIQCSTFSFESAQLIDSGVYLCLLNNSKMNGFSYGTLLHVYEPLQKTLNLSEKTKNRILTFEGILLLLGVLLPATIILCQTKRQNELEKKKVLKETENIYQGLNLDECCPKYDQIERSHNRGPYQDVCNVSHADEFQLEKP